MQLLVLRLYRFVINAYLSATDHRPYWTMGAGLTLFIYIIGVSKHRGHRGEGYAKQGQTCQADFNVLLEGERDPEQFSS
jgi:hypothetical protein